ncbi:porin [Chitinophaga sp. SYP-B3965]|uniref:porin n=1 Tax=Chitinophaga sp. SYP-B3965 TaxID=2663120 RepID=UPI001299A975|nr:porin [Chitinophaga sp. SYP-B3965]MRG47914.1 porin [Chitinophaga sp. SYP-B3965]
MKPLLFLIAIVYTLPVYAQQVDETSLSESDTITNFSAYKRSLSFAGVLQTRYVASLTKNVDVNGKNYDPAVDKGTNNSFLVKRARIMVKANINDHFSANILANFADFSGNPANKVLENAFIRYSLNKYFNVQAGQFRPFMGIEDIMPVDIIRTVDFSNQYYAFGKNGWQSFQVGLSVFGDVNASGNLRYYAGVYNGNNRNENTDDDNTKNLYARVEASPVNDLTIGVNAGSGSLGRSAVGNAYGMDASARISLSRKWKLLLMGEYKSGTNFVAYNSDTLSPKPAISQFRMKGFYFFPTLRYEYHRPRVRAMEFSARYEYFDENDNPRQTIVPNVSFIFADNFYAALQMGVTIDLFKKDIPLTTTYSRNLVYVQLQIRI